MRRDKGHRGLLANSGMAYKTCIFLCRYSQPQTLLQHRPQGNGSSDSRFGAANMPATVANSAMTRASNPALKAYHPVMSCAPGGRLLQRALQRGKLAGHRIGLGRRRQAARLGRIALARVRQRSSLAPRACHSTRFWV